MDTEHTPDGKPADSPDPVKLLAVIIDLEEKILFRCHSRIGETARIHQLRWTDPYASDIAEYDRETDCLREKYDAAVAAYEVAAGSYRPRPPRLIAARYFDSRIRKIASIVFHYREGAFLCTHKIDIRGKDLVHSCFKDGSAQCREKLNYPCNRQEFVDRFRALHIGEWDIKYSNATDASRCVSWHLTVHYKYRKECCASSVEKQGTNEVPYNFRKFLKLLAINCGR